MKLTGLFILLGVFLLILASSWLVAALVYRKLLKQGNPSANLLRWVTMAVSFVIILGTVVLLFLYNVRIER